MRPLSHLALLFRWDELLCAQSAAQYASLVVMLQAMLVGAPDLIV